MNADEARPLNEARVEGEKADYKTLEWRCERVTVSCLLDHSNNVLLLLDISSRFRSD